MVAATCADCGGSTSPYAKLNRSCATCVKHRYLERVRCGNGHVLTEDNVRLHGPTTFIARCTDCERATQMRYHERKTHCPEHESALITAGSGRKYCRPCLVAKAIAQGECRKGHRRREGNIRIDDSGRVTVRCTDCIVGQRQRWFDRDRKAAAPVCDIHGAARKINSADKLYCPECVAQGSKNRPPVTVCPKGHEKTPDNVIVVHDKGKTYKICQTCQDDKRRNKAEAAAERRRERDNWFDWVVVERVVEGAVTKPGRRLTKAEWAEVLQRLKHLSDNEIAERAGCSHETVERYRRQAA